MNNPVLQPPRKPPDKNISSNAKMKYAIQDSGPYFVYVEKKEISEVFLNKDNEEITFNDSAPLSEFQNRQTKVVSKPLHPMIFGKFLFQKMPHFNHSILGVFRINRNKIRVQLQTASDANKLIDDPILTQNGFDAFIPYFLVNKIGLIRNYPFDLDVNDLVDTLYCVSPYKIIKAERMNRLVRDRTNNDPPELTPTGTIKVTFQSQSLPTHIIIHSVRSEVTPFIPKPIFCQNCLRYGHRSLGCRSKQRCPSCGNQHGYLECEKKETPECIYCKTAHSTTDFTKCQEYKTQHKIKEVMTLNNFSFIEALKIVKYEPYKTSLVTSPPATFFQNNTASNTINSQFPPLKRSKTDNGEKQNTNIRKHHKFTHRVERKPSRSPLLPNFHLPNMQINLGSSPLPFNSHRPAQSNNPQSVENPENMITCDESDSILLPSSTHNNEKNQNLEGVSNLNS